MKYITISQLETLEACQSQRDLFRELFGSRVAVTEEALLPHAGRFDWNWAATRLLSAAALAEYEKAIASAWAEHQKARATARAELSKARATAWAEYEKAAASAWVERNKARATALAEYDKAAASAWVERNKAIATAFIRLYNAEVQP